MILPVIATSKAFGNTLPSHRSLEATIAKKSTIPKPSPQQKLDAGRKFAIDAARLAASTRCQNVVVLDVSGLSPITDYFVLATGTSPRQMRSVSNDIAELGEQCDFAPLSQSGQDGESWILTDFVDVVLHLFSPDARQYYDLDNLWGDAKRVEWIDAGTQSNK